MSEPALQTESISLTVDPEFQRLVPALRREELELLEASLLREGCRDPLAAWNGILVDGHNRYRICVEHGLPFEVAELNFASRTAAEDWIITNQLGRRNLTAEQFRYFIGEHYNREKKADGRPTKLAQVEQVSSAPEAQAVGAHQHGRRLAQVELSSHVPEMQVAEPPGETAQRIAATHGVSRATLPGQLGELDGDAAERPCTTHPPRAPADG